ncbi:hypothetical protein HZB89_02550 [archaeon]|nr:hypothetical protein [archaeon]
MDVLQKRLTLIALFIASFILLAILSIASQGFNTFLTPLPAIDLLFFTRLQLLDWMIYVMPLAGFFFAYLSIDWIDSYFESGFSHSVAFPAVLIIFSLLAFWLACFIYFQNIYSLQGSKEVVFDFWGLWKANGFYYFPLAGVLGWLSHLIMHKAVQK